MVIRKDSTFFGIWEEFTQNTNMHGVGSVGRPHSSVIRVTIWAILTIAGVVALGITAYGGVTKYLKRAVTAQTFPAVTICNLNPVRVHLLDGLALYDYNTYTLWAIKEDIKVNYSSNPFAFNMDPGYTGTMPPPPTPPQNVFANTQASAAGRKKRQSGGGATPAPQGGNPQMYGGSQTGGTQSMGQTTTPPPGAPNPPPMPVPGGYQSVPPDQYITINGSEWAPDSWDQSYWSQIDGYDTMWEVDYLRRSFLETLGMANQSVAKYLGHQKDTMIVDCTFEGRICTPRNFTWLWNYKYGNCYTFNAGWNASDAENLRKVGRSGPLHGLSLELFIEESQYTEEITPNTGMKVVVHAPDRFPFPEDEGIQLPTGFLTSVGVRMVNITRAKAPLATNCADGEGVPNAYITPQRLNVSYSNQICLKTCTQIATIKKCGCANAEYPSKSPIFNSVVMDNGNRWGSSEMLVCLSSSFNDSECLDAVNLELQQNQSHCHCNVSCNDVIFNAKSSMSKWPSNQYSDTLMTKLTMRSPFWANQLTQLQTQQSQPSGPGGGGGHQPSGGQPQGGQSQGGQPQGGHGGSPNPPPNEQQKKLIERNMLKLTVYYEDLNYELISESEAYSSFSLMSDIGGNMGMWIGLSAIALCEFLELFIDLLFFVLSGGSLTR